MLRAMLIMCSFLLTFVSYAAAGEIYIAQNATGANNGFSCSNAHSASWFNMNAIGGNTYHLCGTFIGLENSTMLTIPASGSIGNILCVLFEDNAVLTSPKWHTNGAIYINGKNYITIDGGTNGIIRNTANGTDLEYEAASAGVTGSGSNVTIKNLTIQNIYVNKGTVGATNINGLSTWGINFNSNKTGNVTIHNNKTTQSRAGIVFSFSSGGGQNVEISNNTTYDHCWGLYVTANNDSNVMISNFNVHGNDVSGWDNWGYPGSNYHQDGMMFSGKGIVDTTPINIYGNMIHGNLAGGSVTAAIYCTYDGTTYPGVRCNIYNNLFLAEGSGNMTGPSLAGGTTYNIYNNTIVLNPNKSNYAIIGGNTGTIINIINNIIVNAAQGVASPSNGNYTLGTVDYNMWYNIIRWSDANSDVYRNTFSEWQDAGFDIHGYYADPLLRLPGKYLLPKGSPAIDKGTALIFPLTFSHDYLGNARPQGLAWDIGAYEYKEVGIPDSLQPVE